MKKIICCFKEQLNSTNLAIKTLALMGCLCLINTIVSVFINYQDLTVSDLAIRSTMSNIFGFLLGHQTIENPNISNIKLQTYLAALIGMLCLLVVLSSHWLIWISQDNPALVEIRNLLFASIGFLLSKAKNDEKISI
ncbi:hypothetical protein [Clostridium tetanomorphum]|uniref:Uncharacterized protein n=1 Tax=Clostridium tetanomorphum TaxID=1553 RepID=A0A923EAA1_CLOTT|nr:hypothetical protein [Clostridium tetanomorphum]MBC2399512.1 hypothetical protein [Clostridium tetanomorphum]NRZ97762.1 hypothetical protein [Clostridium tetanomorphum]